MTGCKMHLLDLLMLFSTLYKKEAKKETSFYFYLLGRGGGRPLLLAPWDAAE